MKLKTIVKSGVVAEYQGQYWGVQHADGHSTSYGWGPIEKAHISDPQYCRQATAMTWTPRPDSPYNPDYEALKKARLISVSLTQTWHQDDT